MWNSFYKTVLIIVILFMLPACNVYSSQLTTYYSDEDNFETISGTIIEMSETNGNLYLIIDIDEDLGNVYDGSFKIIEDNFDILEINNFILDIVIGDKISFITAPQIFGDGYIVPIVEINMNDISYLEFDEGLENLISWCEKQ